MSAAVGPRRWLSRLVTVRPGEWAPALWSFAYFALLLGSYYVLRPLREEMGVASGVENLQWLFTGTFVVMLAATPLFGAVVARLPRRRFIPLVYQFLALNLILFWVVLRLELQPVWTARILYVWVGVFNLFAVSVFWSFMADLFRSEQAKRLFGMIAAGGSVGTLAGPALTVALVERIGTAHMLLVALALLQGAIFCAWRLERAAGAAPAAEPARAKAQVGGGWLAGFVLILRSPYLAAVAAWVVLLSLAGTFLYFLQANLVAAASDDPAVRTRIFATIDFAAALATILVQTFLTGRLMKRFGVGPAVALLPLVFVIGFVCLAASPVLIAAMVFQTVQRTTNFAISNPAREVLFTVVGREEKYKAKNVVDAVVFRGSDAAFGWLFAALQGGAALGLSALALVAVPVSAAWVVLALWLGRAQERRAALAPPLQPGSSA